MHHTHQLQLHFTYLQYLLFTLTTSNIMPSVHNLETFRLTTFTLPIISISCIMYLLHPNPSPTGSFSCSFICFSINPLFPIIICLIPPRLQLPVSHFCS